ncbi:MAG: site-specific integrase [Pyrinomonadaceae bacterium]
MASIKNRGKNKWFVRVFLGRELGKIRFHDKLVRGEKKDAKAYADRVEAARDNGTREELLSPKPVEVLTLGAYLDRWLAEAVKPSVRETTYDGYSGLLDRYVRPPLGKMALAEVTPPDVQALYNSMKARGLSTRMIQYTHAVLRSALKQAVGWQLITLNPADYTRRPKSESDELETAETGKIRVLDAGQTEAFIKAAKPDPMGAALVFALATGARPEEYLALRWSDVDFEKGEVRIQRVVQWRRKDAGGGFYFLPPKTKKSRRTLRVSESVLKLLQSHRRAQMLRRLKVGADYQQLDLAFASSTGTPMQRRNLHRRHMVPVLEAAGLDKTLYLYCLRHTFATLALAGGLDPKEVSMMMGHSSVAFTQDRYQHVLPSMREATSHKLEKLLFNNRIGG